MAKRQVEHYVVQLEPGSFFSEEYTHRVQFDEGDQIWRIS